MASWTCHAIGSLRGCKGADLVCWTFHNFSLDMLAHQCIVCHLLVAWRPAT